MYMADYDKNKESSFLKYWDVNNFYGWAMWQNLPVGRFIWVGNSSKFNENFIKNYNEDNNIEYFLKGDVQHLEELRELHNDLPFFWKGWKLDRLRNF